MKQVAEYIIPIIQDGKNCVPDFLQAKELIRCKDCKHRVSDENGNARICNHPNNNAWNISDMHYCGYAERRGKHGEND